MVSVTTGLELIVYETGILLCAVVPKLVTETVIVSWLLRLQAVTGVVIAVIPASVANVEAADWILTPRIFSTPVVEVLLKVML